MGYVYAKVKELEGTPKVGSKQCVALVQHYAKAPATGLWREGESVITGRGIPLGAGIATFVDGKYSSHGTGNHAALYLSHDAGGIWIMDQWVSDERKPTVSKRYVRRKGKRSDGTYPDPSNNADAYSVIQ